MMLIKYQGWDNTRETNTNIMQHWEERPSGLRHYN